MSEKEFNLLYEPWIMVMDKEGRTEEISMSQLYENAHNYYDLAGELSTQDVALLRLLLAVLHAVFSRYDIDGNYAPLVSPGDALDRWKSVWDIGTFPMGIIKEYLENFAEKFYLFHPEYPFYQIPNMGKATYYTAAKLNGIISESSNKVRLFSQRSGVHKQELSYSEAARWLLYVNAFDDTASKKTEEGLPSPGAGWLGKLGLITAVGGNLFETLLLNLVLLKDGGNEMWSDEHPLWEKEKVKSDERTEIVMPDNLSQLYTLQSRRLSLKRDDDKIIGYDLIGGDFFPKENTFNEQMSLWRNITKRATDPPEYTPRRHDPSRQLWRDFSVLLGSGKNDQSPGLIKWLSRLARESIIPRTHYQFKISGVKYGDKDFFIDDAFFDTIRFSGDLLTDLGEDWVTRITSEIETTDRLVRELNRLAKNITKAAGGGDENASGNTAKEQAYYRIDQRFRQWLDGINPQEDSERKDEICNEWWAQAQQIVRMLGKELVNQAGPQAFIGRVVQNKATKKDYLCTAPEAYNRFIFNTASREGLNRLYKKEDANGG